VRLVASLAVASLSLMACGSNDTGTGSDEVAGPSAAAESDLKVGLAYDVGGRGDRSFNDSAAAGLDQAKEELGIEAEELSPNASGSDRGDNLRTLAEDGFDPIIAGRLRLRRVARPVATDFPDTTFLIVDDASVEADNVKALLFAEEQGSFLVGAPRASRARAGSVGYIGGVETPLLQKFEAGFVAGAKQVKPDIETQVSYLSQPPDFSGFGDPARAWRPRTACTTPGRTSSTRPPAARASGSSSRRWPRRPRRSAWTPTSTSRWATRRCSR
jgi:basic membrane protein A